jgi:hypothetical protein
MSDENSLRAQLRASFKNRAMVYVEVYRVLAEELGPQRAAELLKRAIYRRGCAVGEHFKAFGPSDLKGLEKAFLDFIPDDGRMFEPEVVKSDGEHLEIQFHACPLKQAWQEEGLPEAEIANMCEIAGVVDNGTFETAGFKFRSETWKSGREGCCRLFIEKGR